MGMSLLQETKLVANKVAYYKDAEKLRLTDKEVIAMAAKDYASAVDTIEIIEKYYSTLLNAAELVEDLRNQQNRYMAVLMMKFWYQMGKMHEKCKEVTLYTRGDYYDKLYYCIDTACRSQGWTRPDEKGNYPHPQACINQAIATRGSAEIRYQSNRDIHKANINAASLDTPINGTESDDNEVTLGDMLADEARPSDQGSAAIVVQQYVGCGKLVDAIIIDNIAYGNSTKVTSESDTYTDSEGATIKVTKNYNEFWSFRLVRLLNSLDDDYADYFMHKYKVGKLELRAALDAISKYNNQKLYKQIDSCREDLKKLFLAGMIRL